MTRAAPRDASWYDHPDVTAPKALHVDNGEAFAVCDPRIPLDERSSEAAADVKPQDRCRRRACALAYRRAEETPHG